MTPNKRVFMSRFLLRTLTVAVTKYSTLRKLIMSLRARKTDQPKLGFPCGIVTGMKLLRMMSSFSSSY
jgi:hypothetical protein